VSINRFKRQGASRSYSPIHLTTASLVECYNTTLQSLLDQYAPFVVVKPRAHTNAPWYDRRCWTTKAATPRLERAYRRDKSESNRAAWKHQSQLLRATLRQRYVAYWSKTIADNSHDSKALWSKLDVLLKTTQQSLTLSPHIPPPLLRTSFGRRSTRYV